MLVHSSAITTARHGAQGLSAVVVRKPTAAPRSFEDLAEAVTSSGGGATFASPSTEPKRISKTCLVVKRPPPPPPSPPCSYLCFSSPPPQQQQQQQQQQPPPQRPAVVPPLRPLPLSRRLSFDSSSGEATSKVTPCDVSPTPAEAPPRLPLRSRRTVSDSAALSSISAAALLQQQQPLTPRPKLRSAAPSTKFLRNSATSAAVVLPQQSGEAAFGWLVLRGFPGNRVLTVAGRAIELPHWFKGFRRVPAGTHVLSIATADGLSLNFRASVKPNEVVVLKYSRGRVTEEKENLGIFAPLVATGAMDDTFLPFPARGQAAKGEVSCSAESIRRLQLTFSQYLQTRTAEALKSYTEVLQSNYSVLDEMEKHVAFFVMYGRIVAEQFKRLPCLGSVDECRMWANFLREDLLMHQSPEANRVGREIEDALVDSVILSGSSDPTEDEPPGDAYDY